MADPVVLQIPQTTGDSVTLDTSSFDSKLASTDNLVQELAEAFDDHTHGLSEATDFIPPNDNLTDLGAADKRWKDIYAGNAVIQTSDRRVKTDIKPIDDPWAFIRALQPVEFRFKDGKRIHTGFIAQDVRDGFVREGKEYAMFCETKEGLCGLRYEEAIAPVAACVKDLLDLLDKVVDEFDNEIARIREEREHDLENAATTREELKDASRLQRDEMEEFAEVAGKRVGAVEFSVESLQKETRQISSDLIDRVSKLEACPTTPPPSKLPLILGASGFVMGLVSLIVSLV